MSNIVKKEINGHEYMFINSSRGNHSGFVHETELILDGEWSLGRNKCQYYNRTWECYRFQSVMKGLVYNLLENCREAWKNSWKNEHGIKRLTAAKKEIMMEELEKNPPKNYMELKELYSAL